MEYVLIALVGYLLGTSSMAFYLSIMTKKDVRKSGSGNLGASNTMALLGWKAAVLVGAHDIGKAWLAVLLAKWIFPNVAYAGAVAGVASVIGHIFPSYLNFRGGKGVATFAGLILAYDIRLLLGLLGIAVIVMIVTDTGHYGPVSAAVLFPLWLWMKVKSLVVFGGVAAVGGLIIYKHRENFARAKEGKEIHVKEFADKCEEMQNEEEYYLEEQI